MLMFDFTCRGCGESFEALVDSKYDVPPCPACDSPQVERDAVVRVAVRAPRGPRGRVIDLSSHACPCPGRPARKR